MKFLLVHPCMDGAQPPNRRTENLGLGYIAAVLRRDGYEVEIFDAFIRCMTYREMIQGILSRDFDCLGITAYDVHKQTLLAIARDIREERKDITIFAGGYFPTFYAEEILADCPEIDFVVRGEGEAVVSDVFGRMGRGEDWRDTPGVACMKDGQPVLNPMPPLIEDLDSLPFPVRDELYAVGEGKLPALIASSRGCYHRCAFCSIPSFYKLSGGSAPRVRSAKNVLDEIEQIVSQSGIREFVFTDDNFIGPGQKSRERVVAIAEEMKARKLDLKFTIECRVDDIDEDILKMLMDVGLYRVFLGVESGVQSQLDRYNKKTTVEQNRKAIEMVRRLGLKLASGLIMVDPYTTVGELIENIDFARQMRLSVTLEQSSLAFVTKLSLYGGVPLIEQIEKDGLLRRRKFGKAYAFRDPAFRLFHGTAAVLGAPLALVNRLRRYRGRVLE